MGLEVPKVHQKDETGCLPACIKMTLDFYIKTGRIQDMEENTIDEIRKLAGIKKIKKDQYPMMTLNDCFALNTNLRKYSLFIMAEGNKQQKDISRLIKSDIPPILVYNVPIYLNGIGFDMDIREHTHCLIVKELNRGEDKVLVNDPDQTLDSYQSFRLSSLLEAWRYKGSMLLWIEHTTKPLTKYGLTLCQTATKV